MTKLFSQLWKYGRTPANYWLGMRTLRTAWLVKRTLAKAGELQATPTLATAIAAVTPLTLSPQPHWRGVSPETIVQFAGFVVNQPLTWGRCVQRSLVAYRLLNGYGFPARICFGIQREDERQAGHAWVELWATPRCALGESNDPYQQYLPVYQSAPPEGLN